MKINVVMSSGKAYSFDKVDNVDLFIDKHFTNQIGIVCNYFVAVRDVYLNPSHVSSIDIED